MAAATAITTIDRPRGNQIQIQFTIASASIGAAGTEINTIAVPGALVGDEVDVTPNSPAIQAGLIVCNARVSAAGVVTFHICNITAGALTPATTNYTLAILRGTTFRL